MADRRVGLVLIALALMGLGASPADAERLPPRDECTAIPSLSAFVKNLRGIVARRDAKALLGLIAADATNSFGDIDAGPKGFAEAWTLDRPATSPVWSELRAVLALGCARDRDRAELPYLSLRIGKDHDLFETYVATGPAVAVRAAADGGAARLATLDWSVVTHSEASGVLDGWVWIAEPEGYVRRSDLRSPIDYRLVIERRRGRWVIAAFVAGD